MAAVQDTMKYFMLQSNNKFIRKNKENRKKVETELKSALVVREGHKTHKETSQKHKNTRDITSRHSSWSWRIF